ITAENGVHLRSSRSHVICTIYYHEPNTVTSQAFAYDVRLIRYYGEKEHKLLTRIQKQAQFDRFSRQCFTNSVTLAEKSQRDISDQEAATSSSRSTVNSTQSSRQSALSAINSVHIPYRNSKLTWLLSDSLGGNARTTMIASESF
ncbi:uncharacterized protein DEA37_0006308, partial [Paragonimus westermani]